MAKSAKALQLLKQLKAAGAKVVKSPRKSKKSKVVSSVRADGKKKLQDFGAWVSWSKSF